MDLANQLGFIHVDELLDELSPAEFNERLAHYRLTGGGQLWHMFSALMAQLEWQGRKDRAMHMKHPHADPPDFQGWMPTWMRTKHRKHRRLRGNDPKTADRIAKDLGFKRNGQKG